MLQVHDGAAPHQRRQGQDRRQRVAAGIGDRPFADQLLAPQLWGTIRHVGVQFRRAVRDAVGFFI